MVVTAEEVEAEVLTIIMVGRILLLDQLQAVILVVLLVLQITQQQHRITLQVLAAITLDTVQIMRCFVAGQKL